VTETSLISSVDFFIRYACIGQLLLLIAYLLYKPRLKQSTLRAQIIPLLLAVGIAAYLLLTAPYSPRPQGFIRSLLLMFTHSMPVFLWLYGKQLFDDGFNVARWPRWGKLALLLLAIFYIYVFLIRGGGGQLQMASHIIALFFIVHLLISVIATWRHDLVEQRRVARFWLVLLVGLFFLMLDVVELSNTRLNRYPIFMLVNASICLIGTSVTAVLMFLHEVSIQRLPSAPVAVEPQTYSRLMLQENALATKLQTFINDGGYLQSDLTISKLAQQLNCAEHHLRKLINQSLGYTNFNAFLNHYRIEVAQQRLVESSLPVLSIALDLGYGSIASFNRAFKDALGTTPTAYRTAMQTRNPS
jgi:AraC-like DNA-binding protein